MIGLKDPTLEQVQLINLSRLSQHNVDMFKNLLIELVDSNDMVVDRVRSQQADKIIKAINALDWSDDLSIHFMLDQIFFSIVNSHIPQSTASYSERYIKWILHVDKMYITLIADDLQIDTSLREVIGI